MVDKLLDWQNDLETHTQELNKKLEDSLQELNNANQQLEGSNNHVQQLQNENLEKDRIIASMANENLEKDRTIASMANEIQHSHNVYKEITTSRSWRVMQKAQRVRLALIPRNGKIERLIKSGVRAPLIFRQEGLKLFTKSGGRKLYQILAGTDQKGLAPPQGSPTVFTTIERRDKIQTPAITVLFIKDDKTSPYLEKAILDWVREQTCSHNIKTVIWQKEDCKAYLSGSPGDTSDAPDWNALMQSIDTPYICLASDDLIIQSQTYLEVNLFALETETLAFTVNLRGSAEWGVQQICEGVLPGDQNNPLLRLVLRKEYLTRILPLISLHSSSNPQQIPSLLEKLFSTRPTTTTVKIRFHSEQHCPGLIVTSLTIE